MGSDCGSRRVRGVLLDVGYTLMDEGKRLGAAMAWLSGALREKGIQKTAEELEEIYRGVCVLPPREEKSLCVETAVRAGAEREWARRLREKMPWDAVELEVMPGAREAVRRLKEAGLKVGVLANQPASAAEDLKRCGLWELLDGVWLSEAVGLAKPERAFFELAMRAWGMRGEELVYVGDRPDQDVAAARKAGMRTVRVRTGPHAAQEARGLEEKADAEAGSLSEAVEVILRWAGR